MKTCTRCKISKQPEEFTKERRRLDGLNAWCRACWAEHRRNRKHIIPPETQKCQICHEVKPLVERNFGRNRSTIHGFQYECKPCKRARRLEGFHSGRWNEPSRLALLKANGRMDPITYPAIFDRDSGVCGVCTEPVSGDFEWPHPKMGSIDHIIPVSRGGTHTFDNVQLAHLGCNISKGADIAA